PRLAPLPSPRSAPSQAIGLRALAHEAALTDHLGATARERERVAAALARIPGVEVLPRQANFLAVGPPTPPGSRRAVWRGLLDRGVLVRDISTWPTLERCLRVTIGTPAENDAF